MQFGAFTPQGSLVGLAPSSSLEVSPLMSIPGALGGGIRTPGALANGALGSNTIDGVLGRGTRGKGTSVCSLLNSLDIPCCRGIPLCPKQYSMSIDHKIRLMEP